MNVSDLAVESMAVSGSLAALSVNAPNAGPPPHLGESRVVDATRIHRQEYAPLPQATDLKPLVMRPKAQYPDDVLFRVHLVHEPVLEIDAARIHTLQIAAQPLERRRKLEGVKPHDVDKFLRFACKARRTDVARIFLRLLGEDNAPWIYHSISSSASSRGSAFAANSDSRRPGTDNR